jgi:oligosaccharyltransferase complex subunit gamma
MKVWVHTVLAVLGFITCVLGGLSKQELLELQKQSGNKVIEVTEDNFEVLLNGKRDYHMFLFLSSNSAQINCALCKEFKPEYDLVGNSWIIDHPYGLTEKELNQEAPIAPKDIFFLSAEFMKSKKLFQVFQLNNIPKVYYFPPTSHPGPNNFLSEFVDYQFYQGVHSELLKSWITELTGHKINLHIPVDYSSIVKIAVLTFLVFVVGYKFASNIVRFFISKTLWTGVSVISVLLLTTGYMFNQIRSTPYLREFENGQIQYFAPGQQNQWGVETQILSFLYGILALLVILLVKKVSQIKNDSVQLIAVCVVSLLIFVFYSSLLSIFGLKGTGYPYRFIHAF